MTKQLILILTLFLSFASIGSAEIMKFEKALTLEVTRAGFTTLSTGVRDLLNKDGSEQKIPDSSITIPLLANINVQNLSYSSEIAALRLAPTQTGLRFHMVINNFKIRIGLMEMANPFMPLLMSSGCEDVEITLGNQSELPVTGEMAMNFVGNRLQLDLTSFNFHMERSQFSVNGPSQCYGPFGIRSRLQRFIVSTMLQSLRPFLNLTLKTQLQLTTTIAETLLANAAHFTIPVSMPEFKILPQTQLLLSAYPYDFAVSPERLLIKLSVNLKPNEDKANGLDEDRPITIDKRLGTLGINPELVNALAAIILKQGSLPFEVTKDFNADLGALLSRRELSVFWPDLEKVASESDEMRASLRLLKAPTLKIDWQAQTMNLNLPQTQLTMKILQNGKWVPYYHLLLDLNLTLQLSLKEGKVALRLINPSYTLDGRWAEGYTPGNAEFNKDGVKNLLDIILTTMAEAEEPSSFAAPIIPFGGKEITLDNLQLTHPFLILDLVTIRR